MGITGLLPLLKKASTNSHVRKFSGCTVGIDAYVWLHKGAFGCAEKLGKGEPTTAYVTYCMKYINVLLAHNVKPILVLDGRNLPSKSETEKKRREKREENRKNAKEFLRKGMKKEAWECFTRCVDITPTMAREFIKVLRSMKIDYIVAPYEADAQLAYLAKKKIIDIVITEDSDLILFGCPKVFFKMNIEGHGVLFDESKLHNAMGLKAEQFVFDRFRWMCILSGCDYLASLPGIGLGRAKKLIDGTSINDIRKILMGITNILRLDIEVPEEYINGFQQADNTFLHQLVFDPTTRQLVPLTPLPSGLSMEDFSYAGSYKYQDLALGMALGNVDIHTLKVVDNFEPMHPKSGYDKTSMWHQNYTPSLTNQPLTPRDLSKAFKMEGMSQSVSSATKPVRKRALTDSKTEEDYNETNDDLRSLYKTTEENDEHPTATEAFEFQEQVAKRIKIQSEVQADEETPNFDEKASARKCEPTKPKNPFLKFKFSKKTEDNKAVDESEKGAAIIEAKCDSSKIKKLSSSSLANGGDKIVEVAKDKDKPECNNSDSDEDDECTSIFFKSTSTKENSDLVVASEISNSQASSKVQKESSCQPICLVDRNRIYDHNARIIVKSQYFKSQSLTTDDPQVTSKISTQPTSTDLIQKNDFPLSIYSLSNNEVDSGYSDEPALKESDDIVDERDQLDTSNFNMSLESEVNQNDAPIPEITLDDDDSDDPAEKPTRLVKLQQYSKTRPLRKCKTASSSRSSSCSKSTRKSDPKQQSLKALFARQEKQKI